MLKKRRNYSAEGPLLRNCIDSVRIKKTKALIVHSSALKCYETQEQWKFMSKIFEITHRDAASRLENSFLEHPCQHLLLLTSGKGLPYSRLRSVWKRPEPIEKNDGKLFILPHRSLPLQIREDIIKELHMPLNNADQAHAGLVVHPFTQEFPVSELYVLARQSSLKIGRVNSWIPS